MKYKRSSGILLHPTSLPGPYGIGDIGPEAHRWIDALARTGCSLWQVLPLGPTGYGDSPYQCFSAFAGNPYLISPDALMEDGLLYPDDLSDRPQFPVGKVDFGAVIPWKLALLDRAYARFEQSANPALRQALARFQQEQADWLPDFALFMALKDVHGGAPWPTWEALLRGRQPEALATARSQYAQAIERHIFRQFIFFRQWASLHQHAADQGIQIIGDIPIFVAHDSADVWANPHLFYLDKKGRPTKVAGVPPDYFSATGQLWGNPLYRWNVHKSSGYAWWLKRFQGVLSLVDIVRLDHFRGFVAYWEIPGNAVTAIHGKWVAGTGSDLFKVVREALGELPIIAEDLGVITPDVIALREQFDLPGMKVFQFAFDSDPTNPFLPHNYPQNCVVYTGTHDNDTARGWFERIDETPKNFLCRYLNREDSAANPISVPWHMIRAVWSSVAQFSLAPMQDFLSLGNEARMNHPGVPSGNWTWRMEAGAMSAALIERIAEINKLYARHKDFATTPSLDHR